MTKRFELAIFAGGIQAIISIILILGPLNRVLNDLIMTICAIATVTAIFHAGIIQGRKIDTQAYFIFLTGLWLTMSMTLIAIFEMHSPTNMLREASLPAMIWMIWVTFRAFPRNLFTGFLGFLFAITTMTITTSHRFVSGETWILFGWMLACVMFLTICFIGEEIDKVRESKPVTIPNHR